MLKIVFFSLGPPSSGGSRGRGRTIIFLRGKRRFWADSGPNPGIFDFNVGPYLEGPRPLGQLYRTSTNHPKLTPETNFNAVS